MIDLTLVCIMLIIVSYIFENLSQMEGFFNRENYVKNDCGFQKTMLK